MSQGIRRQPPSSINSAPWWTPSRTQMSSTCCFYHPQYIGFHQYVFPLWPYTDCSTAVFPSLQVCIQDREKWKGLTSSVWLEKWKLLQNFQLQQNSFQFLLVGAHHKITLNCTETGKLGNKVFIIFITGLDQSWSIIWGQASCFPKQS